MYLDQASLLHAQEVQTTLQHVHGDLHLVATLSHATVLENVDAASQHVQQFQAHCTALLQVQDRTGFQRGRVRDHYQSAAFAQKLFHTNSRTVDVDVIDVEVVAAVALEFELEYAALMLEISEKPH